MPLGLLMSSHTGLQLILEHVRSLAASGPWHWLFPLPGMSSSLGPDIPRLRLLLASGL